MANEGHSTIYLLQENKTSPVYLCAIDHERNEFYKFPLAIRNAARLASECSAVVADSHGTPNPKFALQEITALVVSR